MKFLIALLFAVAPTAVLAADESNRCNVYVYGNCASYANESGSAKRGDASVEAEAEAEAEADEGSEGEAPAAE